MRVLLAVKVTIQRGNSRHTARLKIKKIKKHTRTHNHTFITFKGKISRFFLSAV